LDKGDDLLRQRLNGQVWQYLNRRVGLLAELRNGAINVGEPLNGEHHGFDAEQPGSGASQSSAADLRDGSKTDLRPASVGRLLSGR
jgi:hypothetical protein